ncbi:vascular cell adhesion protein 1b [Trichomycterus rosablanca]|uniref:vascular cell adhesion protein 1b n=1 Tax=Trichomycterus rosablanca TaxID=2290929 RepID=UPI002F35FC21
MVPELRFVLTVLLPLFSCHTAASSIKLELSPKKALFQIGDRGELTCQMDHCSEEIKFSWGALMDKPHYGEAHFYPTKSTLVFSSVAKKHENIIKCMAKCKDVATQASVAVRVYSFPKDPVITGHDQLVPGQENTLTCKVSDIYPAEYMEVNWLRGDKVVETKEGKPDMESIQSDYTFTPQSDDDGQQITCRASLALSGLASEKSSRETNVSMVLLAAPHNVRVSEPRSVAVGSSLSLRCEADGNPKPVFTWRFIGPAGRSVVVGETETLSLSDVTLSDSGRYECEASNKLGREMVSVNVTVQGPPVNTVISVSPSKPKENELITILCVSDSNPKSRLVLSKVLDGNQTELVSELGPEVSVIHHHARVGDSGLYVCEAINEYGSQNTSIHVNVETHPLEVSIQPNGSVIPVTRGFSMTLFCQASGCPHPQMIWSEVKHLPSHTWDSNQTTVSQLGPWTVELDDDQAFICEVKCGSVIKSKRAELKVLSFPSEPTIESSGPYLDGKVTNLTCAVSEVYPADRFHIQWLDGETELQSVRGSFSNELEVISSTRSYQLDSRIQNKTITCKVSLEMDGVLMEKKASTTLTVHYAPRQTVIIVTPQEQKEGEPMSISCLTDSFPTGQVILSRVLDGEKTELVSGAESQISFTIPSAKLSDSGTYVCEAANEYGHQKDSVQLTVQAPPRNTTVSIYPSAHVQEGQNITICCHSVSFPPPAIMLRKLDSDVDIYSPDGTFLLINLTPNDTGLYQVNVTNSLGYETEVFRIHVMETHSSPFPSSTYFVIPAIGLGVLASVVGMLEYLRRAMRKGSYDLTESKPRPAQTV